MILPFSFGLGSRDKGTDREIKIIVEGRMKYYVLHREHREVVLTNFSKRTFHFGSPYFPDSTLSCFFQPTLPENHRVWANFEGGN